jgi:hypothetical protein
VAPVDPQKGLQGAGATRFVGPLMQNPGRSVHAFAFGDAQKFAQPDGSVAVAGWLRYSAIHR